MPFPRIEAAALAALLLVPATAHAADPETLTCLVAEISTETRIQLDKEVRANLTTQSTWMQGYSDTVKAGLTAAAERCGEKHGWSPAARIAAMRYAGATTALQAAIPILDASELDRVALDRFWDAQPTALRNRALTATDTNSLGMQISAQGLVKGGAQMELAGEYIGMLSLMTFSRDEFEGS